MLRHLTYGMVNCEKLMGKTFAFFYFMKIHIEGDIHISLTVTKSLQKMSRTQCVRYELLVLCRQ